MQLISNEFGRKIRKTVINQLSKTEREIELKHCFKEEVEKAHELAMAIKNKNCTNEIRSAYFGAQHKSDKAMVDLHTIV